MKENHISLRGHTPEKLLGLLQNSLLKDSDVEEDNKRSNESMRSLLIHYLEMPIVTENQIGLSKSSILTHAALEASATQGFTIQRFWLSPDMGVSLLIDIKEKGKHLAARGDTEAHKEVGVALYYSAIASSLVYHYKRISSYSLEKIAAQLQKLLNKGWITPELQDLMVRAYDQCRQACESNE